MPAITVLAVAGALLAGPSPTGSGVGDVLWTAALAVAVVAASSVAPSWSWVVAAGIAAVFADDDLLVVAGALVLVVIATVGVEPRQRRAVGAAIGAAVVQLALRLPQEPFAASALIAAAAFVPLLVGGWSLARSRTRAIVVRVAEGAAVVCVVGTGLLAVAAVAAKGHVERGMDRAEEGLEIARRGDAAEAAGLLEEAHESLEAADGTVGAWWTSPARLVPFVGHQQEALREAVDVGSEVAGAAAESAEQADLDEVRLVGGRIDLDAVAALAPPIEQLDRALARARATLGEPSPWVLGYIADRYDRLSDEVDDASGDARLAAAGVDAAPALLGGDRPAHYLVLFGTEAESLQYGGLVGAYAEVIFDDGRMTMVRSGNVDDLNAVGAGGRVLTDPDIFPPRFLQFRPEDHWQGLTLTPDFPTAAEAARQLWPQSGGGALDGVVYLDATGVAALLELTGPITVGEGDQARVLDAGSAKDFFLRELYSLFPESAERDPFVVDALESVFDALVDASLPGPEALGAALGPAAARGHLAVVSFDRQAAEFLRDLGIDGALPSAGAHDFVSVRWDNFAPNKIDPYLERAITYDVVYDADTGETSATLTVELHNAAPAGGLPPIVIGNRVGLPDGTNRLALAVLSPLQLRSVTVDGQVATSSVNEEYGVRAYATILTVPPGGTTVVEYDLAGVLEPADVYRLVVSEPAAANAATWDVVFRPATAADGTEVTTQLEPDLADELTVELDRFR